MYRGIAYFRYSKWPHCVQIAETTTIKWIANSMEQMAAIPAACVSYSICENLSECVTALSSRWQLFAESNLRMK